MYITYINTTFSYTLYYLNLLKFSNNLTIFFDIFLKFYINFYENL